MRIAILGYGLQGKSSFEYYNTADNDITICEIDESQDLPDGIETHVGDSYLDHLYQYDLIVRSPGIHTKDIVNANGPDILSKVTTNTNEFFKSCPTKNIIGVTGTKGKGTTSTLIAKMLQSAGEKVHLGGNIGVPPLDLLRDGITENDWVVLELANFQLMDLKYSPHIGVCLMVEPEHLDWHSDVDEYYQAKTKLFRQQNKEDIAIYYADNENSIRIASTGAGITLPFCKPPGAVVAGNHIVISGEPIIRVSEIKLLGKHNLQNVCAAVTAASQISNDVVTMAQVLREFSGLPFRLEFRKKINDIAYYNDSFASAPPATIAAIKSIAGNKILIIGGKDRGLELDELANTIAENSESIGRVILIGESADRLANTLKDIGYENFIINKSKDMNEIVKQVAGISQPHDRVILSPGFPSFDMFKNFEDRGQQYNEAVNNL